MILYNCTSNESLFYIHYSHYYTQIITEIHRERWIQKVSHISHFKNLNKLSIQCVRFIRRRLEKWLRCMSDYKKSNSTGWSNPLKNTRQQITLMLMNLCWIHITVLRPGPTEKIQYIEPVPNEVQNLGYINKTYCNKKLTILKP